MANQGIIEIIEDWRSNHTIDELRQMVLDKGYSVLVVGEFPCAVLKNFDFLLTKSHCNMVSYDLTIYINKNWKAPNQIPELALLT